MTSAPPIGFEYRASRLLMLALMGVAVLAIISIFDAGLSNLIRSVLVALVGAGFGAAFAALLRPHVRSVLWRTDGSAELGLRDTLLDPQHEVHAELHASHVLGPLITMKFRWRGRGRATLWLLPDNLDADTRRQVRMRLRSG